ncbi:MAG: hypothetical protein QOI43_2585 [Gaiellales bacterium]|nr:hypothetical protein [Gaiellales bacterium]
MSSRIRIVLVAVGAIVLAAVVTVAVLVLSSGGSGAALKPPTVAPAVQSSFPGPPAGAFTIAREDDKDVLALAVLPKASHEVGLQVSDVTQEGDGARGLRVSFTVTTGAGTRSAAARACGDGCYGATVPLPSRPLQVQVRVRRPGRTTHWTVSLPAAWPAKDARAVVARASRVWRQLHSLRYRERLGSDPTHSVVSDWQIVAPDRLAYQIQDEGQAVIVGVHRWDRPKGGSWLKTSALRLHQPTPFWVEATDAHIAGSGTLRGRPVWRVSFFDPKTPGWFVVAIDRKTYRTLDVRMTAAAHFMHDSYGSFNTSIKIAPPATG